MNVEETLYSDFAAVIIYAAAPEMITIYVASDASFDLFRYSCFHAYCINRHCKLSSTNADFILLL